MMHTDDELTFLEAAALLHVSPAYLSTLVEAGKLGAAQREKRDEAIRLSRATVLDYREEVSARRRAGLDAMAAASEEMGLYDAELQGIPRSPKKGTQEP